VSGPLSTVLAEMQAGTPTVAEIVRRSGLEDSVVRAAAPHPAVGAVPPPPMMALPAAACRPPCLAAAPAW
jgi:hypothetical protein